MFRDEAPGAFTKGLLGLALRWVSPLRMDVASSCTEAQPVDHGPSSQPLLAEVAESLVYERVGGARLADREGGPILAAGMGLAPLLGDWLGEAARREFGLEEVAAEVASPAVPRRRFLGRASASWAGFESRAVVDITMRPGTSAGCSRRSGSQPSDRRWVGWAQRREQGTSIDFGVTKGRFLFEESVVESCGGKGQLESCSGGRRETRDAGRTPKDAGEGAVVSAVMVQRCSGAAAPRRQGKGTGAQ